MFIEGALTRALGARAQVRIIHGQRRLNVFRHRDGLDFLPRRKEVVQSFPPIGDDGSAASRCFKEAS